MEADTAQPRELRQQPQPLVRAGQGWNATPADPRVEKPEITPEELSEWEETRRALYDLAQGTLSISMGEAARRAGIAGSTLSSWYAGKWRGSYANITADVQRWMTSYLEQRQASLHILNGPGWVETPTAMRALEKLTYAQTFGGMAIITLGSGMGKTTVIERVVATRPHAWHVTMSPATKTIPALMRAIAAAVNCPTLHAAHLQMLIGEKLQRNGRQTLLMVDEAQHLGDEAVNQLRYFSDVYKCGVALLGNDEAYQRWAATKPREGYGQLHSRFAYRMRRLKPAPGDVEAYVAAWKIEDPAAVRLLLKIGNMPGTLRQVAQTIRDAGTIAGPQGRPISAADIRDAWSHRGDEEVL